MDVGGVFSPREEGALRSNQFVPSLVSGEGVRVEFGEKSRGDDLADDLSDFVPRGPDVSEHDGVALSIHANGVDLEVDVNVASECVGNNERRGGKIVGTGVG